MVVIAILEIAICVGLMIYLLKQKKGEKYSAGAVIKFLGFGALALIIGVVVSILLNFDVKMFGDINPLLSGFLAAFLTAAVYEEVLKYIFFRLSLIKNKGAVNHLDVIIGAALVGIGFTVAENIEFAISGSGNVFRALLPMHILFQLVMGYFYGKAKVTKKAFYHVLALVVPIVLHTIFDMPIICMMTVLGDIKVKELTEENFTSLPYYNYFVPLIVAFVMVTVGMLAFFIVSLVNVGRWSKSGKKQELLTGENANN